tara:strand:+ start:601 stop:711 length:111 start_codon:yes stop_codon:yes gene_type:complete
MILGLVSSIIISSDAGRGILDKKSKRKEEMHHVALH